VEDCDLSWQGDDNLAVWSAGDRADNITFRNNVLSQAKTENLPKTRWGNCVAIYGGSRITVSNTTCYHSSNAGVKMVEDFEGSWGENSSIQVHDTFTDEHVPSCQGGPAENECEEAKPIAKILPGWIKHSDVNCLKAGTVVQPDAYYSTEGITAAACMAACAFHSAVALVALPNLCTAVVTTDEGHCYFRKDIKLDSCESDVSFNLWLAPSSLEIFI